MKDGVIYYEKWNLSVLNKFEEKEMIRDMDFPENWKIVKLKDYVYFQEGPGLRNWQFQNKGIKIINVRNIVDNFLILKNTKNYCSKEEVEKRYKHFLLEENDIVMASSGVTWGKTAIVQKNNLPLMLNTSVIRLRSTNDHKLTKGFLKIFLDSHSFKRQIERLITGGCQPNFGPSHLKKIRLILPPIHVQHKIVALVEKLKHLKKWRKEADKLTEQFLNSVFYDMFGDPITNSKNLEIKKLKEIAKVNMGQSPKGDSYNNKGVGMPLLNGPTEFGLKHPTVKQWTSKPTKLAEKDSILFCVRGATAGRMNWADKQYCIGRGIASITSKGTVSNEYLYLVLKNRYSYFQNIGQGSTFINISKKMLSNVLIPVPEKELMKRFVNKAVAIERIKEYQKKSILQINNLFNVLMEKAFRGKLAC